VVNSHFNDKKSILEGIEELLWFIRGSTNGHELAEKRPYLGHEYISEFFLDHKGLHNREEGDLGPIYGFQWRHFGAEYKDMHSDYTGQGVDQLKKKIKNSPNERTLVICAWNPKDLPRMALPLVTAFSNFMWLMENYHVNCINDLGTWVWGCPSI
jgi:thymidylate synthase